MNQSDAVQLHILVVDDDSVNQHMMGLLLASRGHTVEFASNGLEALDAVKNKKYDIVFMDLQMPVMDGLESSRRIREWEKDGGFNTFIVALTASYLPEKGGELFAAGIDNYIAKPFKVEQIYRMVGYCTSGSSKTIPQQVSLPSGETNNLEILDVQSGLQRMGGNLNIYTILLAEFLGELQERLELLQGCLKSDDFHGLARAAHNLKGVSASLGALQLSEYAKRLESHSNAGYTSPLPDLLAEIKASGYALKQAGQLFLSKSGSVIN